MSLKPESFEILKNEMKRRVDKLPPALGLDAYGITAEDLGMDDEFIERLITEAYLGIFTVEEVEEMVVFQQRFADRSVILEQVVSEAVQKVMSANEAKVFEKLSKGEK